MLARELLAFLKRHLAWGMIGSKQQYAELDPWGSTQHRIQSRSDAKVKPYPVPAWLQLQRTARRCSKSDLFPINMMVMLELECCLASSSHEVRWLKVSRLCRQTHC